MIAVGFVNAALRIAGKDRVSQLNARRINRRECLVDIACSRQSQCVVIPRRRRQWVQCAHVLIDVHRFIGAAQRHLNEGEASIDTAMIRRQRHGSLRTLQGVCPAPLRSDQEVGR